MHPLPLHRQRPRSRLNTHLPPPTPSPSPIHVRLAARSPPLYFSLQKLGLTTSTPSAPLAFRSLDHPMDCCVAGRRAGESPEALALEYIALQQQYPADLRSVKQHLFNICYAGLQVHTDLRTEMHRARTLEQMRGIVIDLVSRPPQARDPFCNIAGDRYTSWYKRHAWEEERHMMRLAANAAVAAPNDGPPDTLPVCDGPVDGEAGWQRQIRENMSELYSALGAAAESEKAQLYRWQAIRPSSVVRNWS